ncbi:Mu transposase C-terminal domain-containing protein [Aureimonas frigidaquae]|uniref:Mu transposase C-terminal domain-containing protein n=1 Tax=Aureimonas frigidaquae TaxID=424757 RepID=UPI000780936D|nr:Mu transposase C-terminal domain-containing protein [Aureimonas frigidaquae]
MATHLTAMQLATHRLPGLPTSHAGIAKMAMREGWAWRTREKSGGGREYAVASLPPAAREALAGRLAASATPAPTPCATPTATPLAAVARTAAGMADWQRRCMDARAAILIELERMAALAGVKGAMRELIRLADAGALRPELQALIPVANARAGENGARTITMRTLFRWRADAARGITALAPAEVRARADAVPAWAPELLALWRTATKRSLMAVMEDLPARLPADVTAPSYDQARRFLKTMGVVDRERGRHGPNGLLAFKTFKRRSTDRLMPMDVVTADGHTFKADVAHPVHGKPFRPEVCAVVDVRTRFVLGWSAGLAESTQVVMDAVRKTVEDFGQFALFYTDNGAGFTAAEMTSELTGLIGRIGATPTNSIAGRAQARGKIERLQATLWKREARTLISYSGRDMDNEARRKIVKLTDADIRRTGASRLLMPWVEFLRWCGATVAAYNDRPHRSLSKIRDGATGRLRHMTPAEAMAGERANGWEPALLPAELTQDLFRPQLVRTVQRGEISLPWGRYFAQALEPYGGERVRVGYDVHDGTKVWVRRLDDERLICIAERDGNVVDEQPQSRIEYARDQREKRRIDLRERQIELIRAERGPALIDLDRQMPSNVIDLHAELEREFVAQQAVTHEATHEIDIPQGPAMGRERYETWLHVDGLIAAGRIVDQKLERWHRAYPATAEYRAENEMAAWSVARVQTAL